MSNEEYLNSMLNLNHIEELLLPISEMNPCGNYLHRSPLINKIKDLRSILNASNEDQGVWVQKNKNHPKWSDVVDLCNEILSKYSKDLQVCAYYVEAKIHVDGFPALAESLSLYLNYCQKYWDDIYPPISDNNLELRLAPFRWLQINLPLLIKSKPFVSSDAVLVGSDVAETITWFWYENEKSLGTNESLKAKNLLVYTLENASNEHITNMFYSFQSVIESLNTLEEEFIPIFSGLEEVDTNFNDVIHLCNEILSFIEPIYLKKIGNHNSLHERNKIENYEDKINPIIANKSDNMNDKKFDITSNSGQFSSPEEAYRIIAQANQYLLGSDPHSPSPYLIRRALELRKKSLYGVLMELFTTTSKPQEIFTLLGLSRSDESK